MQYLINPYLNTVDSKASVTQNGQFIVRITILRNNVILILDVSFLSMCKQELVFRLFFSWDMFEVYHICWVQKQFTSHSTLRANTHFYSPNISPTILELKTDLFAFKNYNFSILRMINPLCFYLFNGIKTTGE